jgi:ferredoxin
MIIINQYKTKTIEFLKKARISSMKKIPVIDLGRCSECGGCIEIAPQVFRYNRDTGLMEVSDLPSYPEALVDEAIKNCPEKCISWENEWES